MPLYANDHRIATKYESLDDGQLRIRGEAGDKPTLQSYVSW
jgi:hypothetical protein